MHNQNTVISAVAKRYANALFDLALEASTLDAVEQSVSTLATLLQESEDLRRLVRSPVFSAQEQSKALEVVMSKANIDSLVSNFVRLVADNRRAYVLEDMMKAFSLRLTDHRGEMTADVISAKALSDVQTKELAEALKKVAGKDINIEQQVDASLLGGVIVHLGSRMIDASLKTRLQSLKFALKEAQ